MLTESQSQWVKGLHICHILAAERMSGIVFSEFSRCFPHLTDEEMRLKEVAACPIPA